MNKSFFLSQKKGAAYALDMPFCLRKGLAGTFLMTVLCIFCTMKAAAQDKIIRKDGKSIEAKVLGKDSKYVRYKRFDNLNGPDYFIFHSDISKIEYDPKGQPLKLSREQHADAAIDIQMLEKKALRYKRRGIILAAAGAAAVIGGGVTVVKLNSDYNAYERQITRTNEDYIGWYKANYQTAPPAGDLQKQESFSEFTSPGIYLGAAAFAGGVALEWIGINNIKVARKVRAELAAKRKELSLRPFYQPNQRAAGLRVAFSF